MPKKNRIKTPYPGVYYIEGCHRNAAKKERTFYIRYRKNGKLIEERVGLRFRDGMTGEKAASIRAECIVGSQLSSKKSLYMIPEK
ncbi:hypothetical protein PITCH_A2410003 [uncultured Desulfobacterium sp.]|uniref:Integrase DNA-binding domain-containing protein n=1 Tax=uncultured Desulfobacterium sp. TaxID=201089 RepID=A0A445MYL8_9BACT|nr:hypothetical protein PITCH_A2410003 [uncultured Desulfobacterium sp.]